MDRKFNPATIRIGNLNNLFFWSELYRQPGELSIVFLVDENPSVASPGLSGAALGGREGFLMAPHARTQSERQHSACVGKRFGLSSRLE
jgi:hypothetical protein